MTEVIVRMVAAAVGVACITVSLIFVMLVAVSS